MADVTSGFPGCPVFLFFLQDRKQNEIAVLAGRELLEVALDTRQYQGRVGLTIAHCPKTGEVRVNSITKNGCAARLGAKNRTKTR